MDLFVLPTYREGFGVVNLEAAAMCLPVITTDTDGVRESIEDGLTGLLVPVREVEPLRQAMLALMNDSQRRLEMGRAGRGRVEESFEQTAFWQKLEAHRRWLLNRAVAGENPADNS
jgi:glycosyltransferase involved in cell wall biosynthesis